jgi:hypothetical protein
MFKVLFVSMILSASLIHANAQVYQFTKSCESALKVNEQEYKVAFSILTSGQEREAKCEKINENITQLKLSFISTYQNLCEVGFELNTVEGDNISYYGKAIIHLSDIELTAGEEADLDVSTNAQCSDIIESINNKSASLSAISIN